jgi:hypothetical protein
VCCCRGAHSLPTPTTHKCVTRCSYEHLLKCSAKLTCARQQLQQHLQTQHSHSCDSQMTMLLPHSSYTPTQGPAPTPGCTARPCNTTAFNKTSADHTTYSVQLMCKLYAANQIRLVPPFDSSSSSSCCSSSTSNINSSVSLCAGCRPDLDCAVWLMPRRSYYRPAGVCCYAQHGRAVPVAWLFAACSARQLLHHLRPQATTAARKHVMSHAQSARELRCPPACVSQLASVLLFAEDSHHSCARGHAVSCHATGCAKLKAAFAANSSPFCCLRPRDVCCHLLTQQQCMAAAQALLQTLTCCSTCCSCARCRSLRLCRIQS